jgi:hypothetical protein
MPDILVLAERIAWADVANSGQRPRYRQTGPGGRFQRRRFPQVLAAEAQYFSSRLKSHSESKKAVGHSV